MNSRPKDPKTARNKNVLIVGGSGSGKTRFWLKPNLLQCTSKTYPTSFVVTDPKGDIVVSCGHALQKNGYQIKILNSLNFKKSMHYNPFAYIHSEKDILKLVTTLIANTKGEGKAGDDFWVKAETLLYTALIGYIHYEAPVEEQNFSTLIEFINAMEVREDDEDFKNPVDLMFDELKKRKPDHFAVRQYAKFKLSAGKTAKSILISCGARLAPFDIQELRELTAYDELQLDTLGDRKTALFIIMSDTDDTFNFLISMCYTQLFNLLCEKADDVYGGRLPVHVRCLIDEAANIGQIPRLEKLVATIRSREISCCLVLQAQSQLKALYKDSADTIVGNMDCSIFLGGKEPGTLKELAAALGVKCYDSELINETAKASGFATSFVETHEEQRPGSFLYSLVTGGGVIADDQPFPVQIFQAQSEVIRTIAARESCVIVGRCADYVLRDDPNAVLVNLFVHAPMAARIRRESTRTNTTPAEAEKRIRQVDKERAAYYNFFSSKRWGDAQGYDLCVNTDGLEISDVAKLVLRYLELRGLR